MTILVVDDDRPAAEALAEALVQPGVTVETAHDGHAALARLELGGVDLVLLDLVMPEKNGLEVLREIRTRGIRVEALMMTGYGRIETAIEAMKLGAGDYLSKPVNLDELRLAVGRLLDKARLVRENLVLKDLLNPDDPFRELVGSTPAMVKIKETLLQVAPRKVTVLVEGESGSGKELVANAVHRLSPRAAKPYLKVNCGALSPNLLESELFGHEKGSFTGAIGQKKGIFEAAHGGTVFLDEIGEMPIEAQVRLLRVLESGEFQRVGGTEPVRVDVRIVAATNKQLGEEVAAGRFREDLFYRLKVIELRLPPLRERLDDVPPLVKRFVELHNIENGTSFRGMEPEALAFLASLPWKGNVRELKNVVDRILVFAKSDTVPFAELPDDLVKSRLVEEARDSEGTMDQIERTVIERLYRQAGGNAQRVSRLLDIPVRTLYRKLHRYGLIEERGGEAGDDGEGED